VIAKQRSKRVFCDSRASARNASFGFSAGKHSGPTTAKFRIKAKAGSSHFDWLPAGPGTQQQRVDFTIKGGDWEEISIELAAGGPLGIVRLYVPMQETPFEIDWIELISKSGSKPTRTAF
jgi:hypothetical protein